MSMRRKVTVMNEVKNFALFNFGHCGKCKHFALDTGIHIPRFQSKMFRFSKCPQITDAQLLTSKYLLNYSLVDFQIWKSIICLMELSTTLNNNWKM